jgi:hypothetical protein
MSGASGKWVGFKTWFRRILKFCGMVGGHDLPEEGALLVIISPVNIGKKIRL